MDWGTHIGRRVFTRIGEDAVYTPAGGGTPATVRGMFMEPYLGALGIESNAPTFSCMAADVAGIKHGATFALRSTTFTVIGVENDLLSGIVKARLQQ